jgi:CRISPR-associated protein (TIGR03986 family)
MTQYIKAPFNFVPLNEKVFFPKWANEVSQDIPFSDGESGEIELELEAQTPIFVRNGHTQADAEDKNDDYVSFSKDPDGNYFIPGTSVKGMIRNVLEIMSFGKMNLDPNMKYATREWDNPRIFDLKQVSEQVKVCCGYLKRENGKVIIENHGKPYRINHKRINEFINTSVFEEYFSKQNRVGLNKSIDNLDPKTAQFKYHLLTKNKVDLNLLKKIHFAYDNEYCNEHQPRRVKFDNSGKIIGDIVFTGQPDLWTSDSQSQRQKDKRKGKFYEFVFSCEIEIKTPTIDVSELQFKQFEFFNKDSDDWKYWKTKFNKGEKVPIFFRHNQGSLIDFGLAFLYKIPFKYSPKELSNHAQTNFDHDKPDLAELIFGFTGKKKADKPNEKINAKGRLQFSPFVTPIKTFESKEVKTTLGSPKASYYPLYVEQKKGENGKVPMVVEKKGGKPTPDYETYHNQGAKISGWKRYPVKNYIHPKPLENPDLNTVFKPLPSGIKFTGKIRFHNLKQVEIGALISAISFHGNSDKLFHQIGLAKPQGFGKIKVRFSPLNLKHSTEYYLYKYEEAMENHCANNWLQSDQISELFTMANDKAAQLDNLTLDYMRMDTNPDNNEFLQAKRFGEYLERYSYLSKSKYKPDSVAQIFLDEQVKKKEDALEKLIQSLAQYLQNLQKSIKANNMVKSFETISTIENLIAGNEKSVSENEEYNSLLSQFQQLKEYCQFFDEAEKLMSEKLWQQAKLLLIDKILPICNDEKRPEIEEKIEFCRKKEGEALDFNSSVDLNVLIDKNKGKIQNYLNKKGKLKQLPEDDYNDFYNALMKWYEIDPRNSKKEWTEFDFKRSVWKHYVAKWVGEEKAKEFFNQLFS